MYLGLHELEDADVRLVHVFLRFVGRSDRWQWQVADRETPQLVLRNRDKAGHAAPAAPGAALTAWLLDRSESVASPETLTLNRPLQIDAFAAVLRACEAHVESAEAAAAPATAAAAPARASTPPAATAAPKASPSPRPPVAAAAKTPAPDRVGRSPMADGAKSPHRIVVDPRVTYRMVRWPGGDLLRNKPRFVRLLGFLSHKAISVDRLVVLSGLDEATCIDMLVTLDERRLLQRLDVARDAASAVDADEPASLHSAISDFSPSGPPAVVAPRPTAAAQSGLLQRLRRRLGL
jgi:hypothetical protein